MLGMHLFQNVDGPTHAHTLVSTILADEHVGDDVCTRVVDNRLPSDAAAELDALGIIRGDVRL